MAEVFNPGFGIFPLVCLLLQFFFVFLRGLGGLYLQLSIKAMFVYLKTKIYSLTFASSL